MWRGQTSSAAQAALTLRQIEVQTSQSKSVVAACKDAKISEQIYQGIVPRQRKFLLAKRSADVFDLWSNI